MAKGKNSAAPGAYMSQLYSGLQQPPAQQQPPAGSPMQLGRMPTAAEIQAMFAQRPMTSSVGSRDPQAIINAQRTNRGMAPIDWAARQARQQQMAEQAAAVKAEAQAKADALRQYELDQAAAIDAFNQRGGSMSDA